MTAPSFYSTSEGCFDKEDARESGYKVKLTELLSFIVPETAKFSDIAVKLMFCLLVQGQVRLAARVRLSFSFCKYPRPSN